MIALKLKDQSVVVRQAEADEIVDLRHRVLRAGLPRSEAIFPGDELPTNFHFGAFLGDVGTAPLCLCCASFHLNSYEAKPAWQLRGMATDAGWANRGLGRAVMDLAISTIIDSSPVHVFWCNARLKAIPFYEKLGWRIVSERFEIPTAGPHHRMVRVLTAQDLRLATAKNQALAAVAEPILDFPSEFSVSPRGSNFPARASIGGTPKLRESAV